MLQNNKSFKVKYLDGGCGIGKTHSMFQYILNHQHNTQKSLYVCDTYQQSVEIETRCLRNQIFPVNLFHEKLKNSNGRFRNVEAARIFQQKFHNPDNFESYPVLVIISWIAYCQMSVEDRNRYYESIFMDDIRSAMFSQDFLSPFFFNEIIKPHLDIDEECSNFEDYYTLQCIKKFNPRNVQDENAQKLKSLFDRVDSHTIYVERVKWDRLSNGVIDYSANNENINRIVFYCAPNKDLFQHRNIHFMRADFKNSEIGLILSHYGYEFEESIAKRYTKKIIQNFNIKVDIEYFAKVDRQVSNYLMEKDGDENYNLFFQHISCHEGIGIFPSQFKDSDIAASCPKITRIPTINQGSNKFSEFNTVICGVPLRFENDLIKFYQIIFNLNLDQIITMGRVQNDLQTAFRSGLRNYESILSERKFKIIVLDHFSSDYLVEQLKTIVPEENITVRWSGKLCKGNVTKDMTKYKRENAAKNRANKKLTKHQLAVLAKQKREQRARAKAKVAN